MCKINNKEDAFKILIKYFDDKQEKISCLCLSNNNKLIDYFTVKYGNIDSCYINFEELFLDQLYNMRNKGKVIIAHNHPKGLLIASNKDLIFKHIAEEYAKYLNINVVDYLIYSLDGVISYK